MKVILKIFQQTLLYLVLVFGYLYLYIVDIDQIIHPEKQGEVKSKIEFIYQQF